MSSKIKKIIVSAICVLSVLLAMQIPVQAVVVDIPDNESSNYSGVLTGNFNIKGSILSSNIQLAPSYSSKAEGYTTPARDQGPTNLCWAYGAMASFEVILKHNNIFQDYLSPLHLSYFATPQSDSTGWQRDYFLGGNSFASMGYVTSWSGAKAEIDFPEYTEYEDGAYLDATSQTVASANSIMYLDGSDHDMIKTAIKDYGSVVGIYYDGSRFHNTKVNSDGSKTYSYYCNNKNALGLSSHVVCVVGWDNNYDKSNFKEDAQPEENGAWLCKNSWGASWGDEGYFWISYEDQSLFDKRFGPSYAFMDYQIPKGNTKLYQNEIYGATYEFDYLNQLGIKDATYINVFDFSDNYTTLDKINFESTSQGSEYTIYYIPLDSSHVPNSDQSTWTELYSGEIEYCGYISVDIDDFTVENGQGAIGIKFQDTTSDNANAVGVCEWMMDSRGNMKFIPKTQHGDSYIMGYGDGPMDLMDFYSQMLNDDIGGTLVIKAIAKNFVRGDVDEDSYLTITDVTKLQRALAEYITLDENQMELADTNKDGRVNIKDVTKIQRVLAALETMD